MTAREAHRGTRNAWMIITVLWLGNFFEYINDGHDIVWVVISGCLTFLSAVVSVAYWRLAR